jgi:hypothetical protein
LVILKEVGILLWYFPETLNAMKSLRYLLVVAWLIAMTTLGLFSNIDSLGGAFDSAQRTGDAYGQPQPLENITIATPTESDIAPKVILPESTLKLQCCAKRKPACRKKKPCLKKIQETTPSDHTETDSMKSHAVVTDRADQVGRQG